MPRHAEAFPIARKLAALMLAMALALASLVLIGCTSESGTYTPDEIRAMLASQEQDADAASDEQGDEAAGKSGASRDAGETKASGGTSAKDGSDSEPELTVYEDGTYTSKEEVALYIHTYGHLPDNFISKTKARKAGWESSLGNLDEVCPGKSIGGSVFYNDEGILPEKEGRVWHECDINYHGGFRGAERIVFSNDGLIYYTDDHYRTFERLY